MALSRSQVVASSLLLSGFPYTLASESPDSLSSIANVSSNLRGSAAVAWPFGQACVALGAQCDLEADGPSDGCCSSSSCTSGAPLAVPVGTCMPPAGGGSPLDHYQANALYSCYEGHGGVELDSVLFADSAVQCAVACDQDVFCAGFVYMASQQKCWKRASIDLASCEVGQSAAESAQFSTFVKTTGQPLATPTPAPPQCIPEGQACGGSSAACCDGTSCAEVVYGSATFLQCLNDPPSPAVAPVPAAPVGYTAHPLYNCYTGHGGVKLGLVSIAASPAACATSCDQDWACRGFVFMYSQSKCWQKAAINLQLCEVGIPGQESSEFITFTKQ